MSSEYDLLLLVPYELAQDARNSKPDDVDELMFKSADWMGYVTFGLTVAQHFEWAVSTYISLQGAKEASKKVRIIRYNDHTELELENYDLGEINPEFINQLLQRK